MLFEVIKKVILCPRQNNLMRTTFNLSLSMLNVLRLNISNQNQYIDICKLGKKQYYFSNLIGHQSTNCNNEMLINL